LTPEEGVNGVRYNIRQAGFTLIEMIVVIAVLGLALSVVASFAPRRHAGLDLASAADGLAETLRTARTQAIVRQSPVLFTPAADGRGYAVDGAFRALPPDVVLTSAVPIRFAPDGSASGGVLRLAGADGRGRLLRLDWLTGQASVADAQ